MCDGSLDIPGLTNAHGLHPQTEEPGKEEHWPNTGQDHSPRTVCLLQSGWSWRFWALVFGLHFRVISPLCMEVKQGNLLYYIHSPEQKEMNSDRIAPLSVLSFTSPPWGTVLPTVWLGRHQLRQSATEPCRQANLIQQSLNEDFLPRSCEVCS